MSSPAESHLGIAVECIECGQDVCVHQQAVIRGLEAELQEAIEALVRIANAESGHWGWIAHEALRKLPSRVSRVLEERER